MHTHRDTDSAARSVQPECHTAAPPTPHEAKCITCIMQAPRWMWSNVCGSIDIAHMRANTECHLPMHSQSLLSAESLGPPGPGKGVLHAARTTRSCRAVTPTARITAAPTARPSSHQTPLA